MAKIKECACVYSQEMLASGIYSMWIETEKIAQQCIPGQFVNIYTKASDRLLPRPISICESNAEKSMIRIVYRVAGSGTKEFSTYKKGDSITLLGPLGNGFQIIGERPVVVGGGIGIPPMLNLARSLKGKVSAVLGYRSELFLNDEFPKDANVYIATDDGSSGTHGTVIDAIRANNVDADVIYACGPTPMLRAVKAYAREKQVPCFVSLEERMACGVGACLGCVCRTTAIDSHSHVKNSRVCKDGPVFSAEEVEL